MSNILTTSPRIRSLIFKTFYFFNFSFNEVSNGILLTSLMVILLSGWRHFKRGLSLLYRKKIAFKNCLGLSGAFSSFEGRGYGQLGLLGSLKKQGGDGSITKQKF